MNKNKLISKINPLFLKGIAHRGLHNNEYTENGLNAFKNALDHNVAIELDVHLSKDNQLIVCHDESLLRTTKKEGIIEDLTLNEIKSNYKLLDGGEVPTLKEVLSLINEQVPIVIEIKVFRKNYKLVSKKLLNELNNVNDPKNFMIISFDPRALIYFRKTKFITSLLVGKAHHYVFHFRFLFDSLDLEYRMLEEKAVKRYFKKHFINVWTIEDLEVFNQVKNNVDTLTFQHLDVKFVQEELSKR